jgi:hypothetical protein
MCTSSELHMHYLAFQFLCLFTKVRKNNTKFVVCVFASAQNMSTVTERFFIFNIPVLFENLPGNLKFLRNVIRKQAVLMKTFVHLCSLSKLFLDREKFQIEFAEKIKIRLIIIVFVSGNHSVYEIMWENIIQAFQQAYHRRQYTYKFQMRFVCRIVTEKMKIRSHARKSLLHHNWQIPSDLLQE